MATPSIIIVDDNPAEYDLFLAALADEKWALKVEFYTTAVSALASYVDHKANGKSADLLLLDVTLNGFYSIPLLKAIREVDTPSRLQPTIVLSSMTVPGAVRDEYLALGAMEVIRKTFTYTDLRVFIARLKGMLTGNGSLTREGASLE